MKKIAYYVSLIPFQLNFFVLLFLVVGAYSLIDHYYLLEEVDLEPTYFIILTRTLALFILVFSLLLFGLGFITAFMAWGYYLAVRKTFSQQPIHAYLGNEKENPSAGYVPLGLQVTGIIKPLLGHVRGRVVFKDQHISPSITLDCPVYGKNKFVRSALKASRNVWIPDIKEHEVNKTILYFEDLFRLFSFPIISKNQQSLLTVPEQKSQEALNIDPDNSIDQDQRIDVPKRIKGELFNYKSFESGDDIRRIVWKIYAKNNELVVRVPETMDPYASHIIFYPSFYGELSISEVFKKPLLNFYKTILRHVYESLKQTDFSIKYKPDQELALPDNYDETIPEWLYYLSTSTWQKNSECTAYIAQKKEGIYCVSSLMNVSLLEEIMDTKTPNTLVFFVKLSPFWKQYSILSIASLFIKTETHPLNSLKRKWMFSSSKRALLKNEEALQKYLDDQLFKTITL